MAGEPFLLRRGHGPGGRDGQHLALTVAVVSNPPGCRAVVGGTSATAGDGRVAFTYTGSAGQLTVLTTGGNLHYYDVRSCRLFPGFSDGAPATLSATFAVSPNKRSPALDPGTRARLAARQRVPAAAPARLHHC